MMFLLHLAYAVQLIALGIGVSMLIWAYRNEGRGVGTARVFGYVITILIIFSLLCTSYYGIIYWAKGYFKSPMMMQPMMTQQMKQN